MGLFEFTRDEQDPTEKCRTPLFEFVQDKQDVTVTHHKPVLGDDTVVIRDKKGLVSFGDSQSFLEKLVEKAKSKDGIHIKLKK